MGVNLHKVTLVSTLKAHLACLAVGVLLYGIEELLTTRNLKNFVNLLHRLVGAFAQSTSTLFAIAVGVATIYLLVVLNYPLPYSALLGVKLWADIARCEAVTCAEDIIANGTLQSQLLATLLALNEETQLLRQGTQSLNYIARGVGTRTAWSARHTLAAIPYRIALHQLLDSLVVTRLHDAHYLTWIVVIEGCGRTYGSADSAVHTGGESLSEAYILHQHIEIFSHKKSNFALQTKLLLIILINGSKNTYFGRRYLSKKTKGV